MTRRKSSPRTTVLGAFFVLFLLAFLLPAVKEGESRLYLLAAIVPAALLLASTLLARVFSLDRLITALVLSLASLGILALAPADPDAALNQALCCAFAAGFLVLGAITLRSWRPSLVSAALTAALSLFLLALPMFVSVLPFRCAEAALLLMLLSFVSFLTLRKQLIALFLAVAFLSLLLVQGELIPAAVWGVTFLLLLWSSSGRLVVILMGLAASLLLFVGAIRLFPDKFAAPESAGLLPPASAGWLGKDFADLGFPAASLPDEPLLNLLSAQYGLVFTALAVLLYPVILLRGVSAGCAARKRLHALLAMGAVLVIGLSAIASLLSSFGVLNLPLYALPFLTADFPALAAFAFLAGLLCGVSARNEEDLEEDVHLAMLAK